MSTGKELSEVIYSWSETFMHHSGHEFKRIINDTGLSFSQISVLMRLYHGGTSSVSEIAEQLGVTNAAASQMVDRLVQLLLIQRTEDPQDRRAKRLTLAPDGRKLITQGIEARCKWVEGLTHTLTLEQQEMIISALVLLTEAARKI
jgi:DNA-binding MarR family transcriptional regulator